MKTFEQKIVLTLGVREDGQSAIDIVLDPPLPGKAPTELPKDSSNPELAAQVIAVQLAGKLIQYLQLDKTELKKPSEWAEQAGITIMDPDGWRVDGKDFEQRITKPEFDKRVANSTIQMGGGKV